MASSALIAGLQEALVGLVVGVVVALMGRLALVRANLRWTWALPPTSAGVLLIVVGGVFESWTFAIACGGVLTPASAAPAPACGVVFGKGERVVTSCTETTMC